MYKVLLGIGLIYSIPFLVLFSPFIAIGYFKNKKAEDNIDKEYNKNKEFSKQIYSYLNEIH